MALTVLAALFAAGELLLGPGHDHGRWPSPWLLLLVLLTASVLLVRSRWPLGALLAIGALTALYFSVVSVNPGLYAPLHASFGPRPGPPPGPPPGPGFFPLLPTVLIAMYGAVAYSNRPRHWIWGAVGGVAVAIDLATWLTAHGDMGAHVTPVLLNSGWMLMAILLGEALRNRNAYALEAELRAAQAEQTQQELAQRRVIEERLRIARELHDILAHTVALINVQAGMAAHVIDQQPEQAKEALEHIKTASHSTLQELRALVGVLRDPEGPAPLEPAPGLGALDDLVDTVRDAGLDVEIDLKTPSSPLPTTVNLAAYRILQEALTNVIKHAGPASVHVTVEQEDSQLKLEVINSGGTEPPVSADGSGHGIAGMRERAAALGGTLQAGPLPNGGFQVRATLPVPGGGL